MLSMGKGRVDSRASNDLQLALSDQSTSTDDRVFFARGVFNDDNVVAASSGHVVVLLNEVGLGDIANRGQDAQAVEETVVEVGLAQSAQGVALRESGLDLGREEVGAEDTFLSHGGVEFGGGWEFWRGCDRRDGTGEALSQRVA